MTWHWCPSPKSHDVLTFELPELLASATSTYMTIQKLGQVSHILAFTDISSALGWMHKALFNSVKEEPRERVSQWLGWTLDSNEVSL